MRGSGRAHRLPRERRLSRSADYRKVQAEGRRVVCGVLILNWLERPEAAGGRVGVIAGRRVGSAVVRNRAKRLLRETYRLWQRRLSKPADVVLVARKSIAGKTRREVERDFLRALKRAGLLEEEL